MRLEILSTSFWEGWWKAFSIEITVAVVLHILASIFQWLWRYFRRSRDISRSEKILDPVEILLFLVYLVVQVGIVMSTLGEVRRLSGLSISDWTWQLVVTSWSFYFVASVFVGWLALMLFSTFKRVDTIRNDTRRPNIFFISIIAKFGLFLSVSGWVMFNPTTRFPLVMIISFLAAIGLDAMGFTFIMLVE